MKHPVVAVLLVACGACHSNFAGISPIPLRGRALYADGTPAAYDKLDFSLLADGENLFPPNVNGCARGDDHAQALQVVTVSTGADGSFSVDVPMTGFVRATDWSCRMAPSAAANVTRIAVRAQTEADFDSCIPYCRQHSGETCYADCVSQGQRFVWSDTITGAGDTSASSLDIRFETLGPALPGTNASTPPLPDLVVDGDAARNSIQLTQQTFQVDDCAVQEACVAAAGTRELLRFDGDIINVGAADLRIGSPVNNPLFEWDACHNHYHLENIMSFELLDQTGAPVIGDMGRVVTRKPGYCIAGVEQVAGRAPNPYTCLDQGLAPGWEDVYEADLNCQWLDVTGVPSGDYVLRITVNPSHTFPESDFDDDAATIPVTIP